MLPLSVYDGSLFRESNSRCFDFEDQIGSFPEQRLDKPNPSFLYSTPEQHNENHNDETEELKEPKVSDRVADVGPCSALSIAEILDYDLFLAVTQVIRERQKGAVEAAQDPAIRKSCDPAPFIHLGKRRIDENIHYTQSSKIKRHKKFQLSERKTFSMVKKFEEIEKTGHLFKEKTCHFYPSKNIQLIYNEFISANVEFEGKTFGEFVSQHPLSHALCLENDTTSYLSKDVLKLNMNVYIEDNKLWKGNKPIHDGEYIFVLDQKNRFRVSPVSSESLHGRMHHSSLTRGKPVITAGQMTIVGNVVEINNVSGHYQPSCQSLGEIVQWLHENKLNFEVLSEKTKPVRDFIQRTLKLKLIS